MKVLTSYYDKTPTLDKDAYTFIRVSRKEVPEWFDNDYKHVDMSEFFGPSPALLAECHPLENWTEFEPRYKSEVLSILDKGATLNKLDTIYTEHGDRPLVLLCYETSEQNCHRHLIGEYLEIDTTEL